MRKIYVLVFALIAVGVVSERTRGQEMQHRHALVSNVIDGKDSPEKIQDKDAYRLFLLSVSSQSSTPTAEEQSLHSSALRMAHIPEKSIPDVAAIINDFRVQYETLVQNFNTEAELKLKAAQPPDVRAFLTARDALVLSTKDKIASQLGEHFASFHGHIQQEKTKMKVAIE
jgi:hypothetical protein